MPKITALACPDPHPSLPADTIYLSPSQLSHVLREAVAAALASYGIDPLADLAPVFQLRLAK